MWLGHQFKEFKDKRVNIVCHLYYKELWDHVPKTGKRVSPPFNTGLSTNSVTFSSLPLPPHSGFEPPASVTTNTHVTGLFFPIIAVRASSTRHGLGCDRHIHRPFQ